MARELAIREVVDLAADQGPVEMGMAGVSGRALGLTHRHRLRRGAKRSQPQRRRTTRCLPPPVSSARAVGAISAQTDLRAVAATQVVSGNRLVSGNRVSGNRATGWLVALAAQALVLVARAVALAARAVALVARAVALVARAVALAARALALVARAVVLPARPVASAALASGPSPAGWARSPAGQARSPVGSGRSPGGSGRGPVGSGRSRVWEAMGGCPAGALSTASPRRARRVSSPAASADSAAARRVVPATTWRAHAARSAQAALAGAYLVSTARRAEATAARAEVTAARAEAPAARVVDTAQEAPAQARAEAAQRLAWDGVRPAVSVPVGRRRPHRVLRLALPGAPVVPVAPAAWAAWVQAADGDGARTTTSTTRRRT